MASELNFVFGEKEDKIMVGCTQNASDASASMVEQERRHLYSTLDVWDDEETKVLESVPMEELVNTDQH